MSIANQLQSYLKQKQIKFRVIEHPHSGSSMESAEKAHVPGDALAKGILLKDDEGYLMVVLPSDYHVDLASLEKLLQQRVALASERELSKLFPDCEPGAVPPLGQVYGIKTIWDPRSSLGSQDSVFFEAGDHRHLLKVSGEQFHELMAAAERGVFSHHI
jgi:Ala-tRNA(Pro) deacylase